MLYGWTSSLKGLCTDGLQISNGKEFRKVSRTLLKVQKAGAPGLLILWKYKPGDQKVGLTQISAFYSRILERIWTSLCDIADFMCCKPWLSKRQNDGGWGSVLSHQYCRKLCMMIEQACLRQIFFCVWSELNSIAQKRFSLYNSPIAKWIEGSYKVSCVARVKYVKTWY